MPTNWYDQDLPRRAPQGGIELFGKEFKGGQMLPFYVPRMVMPQVDEEFYPQLIDFAREHGVGFSEVEIAATDIRPHQRVDHDHLRGADLSKPILGSREPFVLDGHHRWAQHKYQGSKVRTYKFDLTFREAIAFLFSFPATYYYGDGNDHAFQS